MMTLRLIRQRIVYSPCIVSALQMGRGQIFAYYLPVWIQDIKIAFPLMSDVYFMRTIGPQILFAILSGIISMNLPICLLQVVTDTLHL
jgi:hypothetical protein